MRRITFSSAARADLDEAFDWYEEQSTGLSAELSQEVRETARQAAAHPLRFPQVGSGIRRARVRRFPYLLFFTVTDSTIRVIACFHTSRDPSVWRKRL